MDGVLWCFLFSSLSSPLSLICTTVVEALFYIALAKPLVKDYNSRMDKNIVRNEFPPVFDLRSKVLILGSLPSVASRAVGFYYMNPRNRFWQMLSSLLSVDFIELPREGKIAALLEHGVALSDVILACEIYRSADASIENVEYTDVPAILQKSDIKAIFLNGQKAYDLFLRRYPEYATIATRLPSTSPANAKSSLPSLIKAWGDAILPFLQ